MKTVDVISLRVAITRFKETARPGQSVPVKFVYAMKRNLELTNGIFEAYQEATKPTAIDTYVKWEAARNAYLESVSNKNEDGTPRIVGNQYDIPDIAAATAHINKMQETDFPTLKEEIEEHNKMVMVLNEEDASVEIYKVPIEEFPKELPAELADVLMYMVRD